MFFVLMLFCLEGMGAEPLGSRKSCAHEACRTSSLSMIQSSLKHATTAAAYEEATQLGQMPLNNGELAEVPKKPMGNTGELPDDPQKTLGDEEQDPVPKDKLVGKDQEDLMGNRTRLAFAANVSAKAKRYAAAAAYMQEAVDTLPGLSEEELALFNSARIQATASFWKLWDITKNSYLKELLHKKATEQLEKIYQGRWTSLTIDTTVFDLPWSENVVVAKLYVQAGLYDEAAAYMYGMMQGSPSLSDEAFSVLYDAYENAVESRRLSERIMIELGMTADGDDAKDTIAKEVKKVEIELEEVCDRMVNILDTTKVDRISPAEPRSKVHRLAGICYIVKMEYSSTDTAKSQAALSAAAAFEQAYRLASQEARLPLGVRRLQIELDYATSLHEAGQNDKACTIMKTSHDRCLEDCLQELEVFESGSPAYTCDRHLRGHAIEKSVMNLAAKQCVFVDCKWCNSNTVEAYRPQKELVTDDYWQRRGWGTTGSATDVLKTMNVMSIKWGCTGAWTYKQ